MQIPFLSSLFRTRDKPQNYYIGTDFRYLFGPSTSGKTVNEFTAMQTTAVYACVRILAETLAALPLQLYRYTPGGKERVYDHPFYHLLHDEPNQQPPAHLGQCLRPDHPRPIRAGTGTIPAQAGQDDRLPG